MSEVGAAAEVVSLPEVEVLSEDVGSNNLPEEPPMVHPSAYYEDDAAGVEFRSSFLFQSSCYLPDDGTESAGSSGVHNKGQPHRYELQPSLSKGSTKGEISKGGSSGSSESRRKLQFYPTPNMRHKRTSQQRHNVNFKEQLSVCGEELSKDADISWRGLRVSFRGESIRAGQSTSESTEQDSVVAQTRAGMSTLTLETAFLSALIPKSRKNQWVCAIVFVVVVAAAVIVAEVCGASKPGRSEGPASTTASAPFIATASPSLAPKVFASTVELYEAVDGYVANGSTTTLEYGDHIGIWDVSLITDFSSVFDSSRNTLVESFNEGLSGWDTSRAITMERMFSGAEFFNGDISTWNTSSVTNMKETFSLAVTFNEDVSQWDVSRVETMDSMCKLAPTECHSTRCDSMSPSHKFVFSLKVRKARHFNGNLERWNTTAATSMVGMFLDCFSFQGLGVEDWDTRNVKSMPDMFTNTPSFKGDLSTWNVAQVSNMSGIFRQSAFNADISGWDLRSVTDISEMVSVLLIFGARAPLAGSHRISLFFAYSSCTLFHSTPISPCGIYPLLSARIVHSTARLALSGTFPAGMWGTQRT